jgi:hypothetical protein
MKKFSTLAIVTVLACSLTLGGCSTAQFDAFLNVIGPAVADIIQIIAIVKGTPANLTPVTKIDADVAAVETLYHDFLAAGTAAQPGIQADINAGFTTLNADLGSVFTVAQVSNPNTQAKITALVSLVETGVNLAEAVVNTKGPSATETFTAKQLKSSFNQVLTAKTGNSSVDAFTAKHKI